MSSTDAAIIAQLNSLKANMANAQMMPRPGMPNQGAPGMPPGWPGPPVTGPTAPQGLPPQAASPMGPGPRGPPQPGSSPLLSVAVNNLPFRYQLAENDLREMCQRWGPLESAQIYRQGEREVGVVVFSDAVDAADCQRQLNGHPCTFDGPASGAQGVLAAIIGPPEQLSPPRPQQQLQGPPPMQGPGGTLPIGGAAGPGMGQPMGVGPMGGPPQMAPMGMGQPHPGGAFPPQGAQGMGMGGFPQGPSGAVPKSSPDAGKGSNGWGAPGWSCKVIVQAERLHHEFPIVLKICGQNNANVDHIRTQGNCSIELRGQRSGAIDARTGQELPEPMYLWLASDAPESGVAALEMVKDLLGSVYDEHQQWCNAKQLKWDSNLQPQVVENPHLTEGM